MNIFYLDDSSELAAKYHCDKHVVKMILETTQLLCTAHRIIDDNNNDILYKKTHQNHPSAVWVRESKGNYEFAYELFIELCKEYTFRYGKTHKTQEKLQEILRSFPTKIPDIGMTKIPLCMPEEYKTSDPIESYRSYYTSKQNAFKMVWTKREKPNWFISKEQ